MTIVFCGLVPDSTRLVHFVYICSRSCSTVGHFLTLCLIRLICLIDYLAAGRVGSRWPWVGAASVVVLPRRCC